MRQIQSMAGGLSSVVKISSLADGSCQNIIQKGKPCIDDSPIRKSLTTSEGNALKSRAYCRDMCLPDQNSNSFAEVDPFENGDSIKSPISLSGAYSDMISDHPHGDSGPDDQFLHRPLGIADENYVEDPNFYDKKQLSKSRAGRRGMKAALTHNRLFSDDEMTDSSGKYAACNREPSVETSSSFSISKGVAEGMQLQSPSMRGEMRDMDSNYINWPYNQPAVKKPKKDQCLVSEISKSLFQIEKTKAKPEDLFPGLHLLADAASLAVQH